MSRYELHVVWHDAVLWEVNKHAKICHIIC